MRKAWRSKTALTRIFSVVVVGVMSCAGLTAPASAATVTRSGATAYWTITDGCVTTTVSLASTQTDAGVPDTFVFLNQEQTCEDPYRVQPVLTLEGVATGGQLTVSSNYTARLVATVPVTCYAYEIGACEQQLYNPGSVSLDLSWSSSGKKLRLTENGTLCLWRYGTATGSILLGGGVNLLATADGTLPADPTETNVQRCLG